MFSWYPTMNTVWCLQQDKFDALFNGVAFIRTIFKRFYGNIQFLETIFTHFTIFIKDYDNFRQILCIINTQRVTTSFIKF